MATSGNDRVNGVETRVDDLTKPEKMRLDALIRALREDQHIAEYGSRISVHLTGDTVTLRGEAGHIAAKRRASALTRQYLEDGHRVVDLLRRDVTKRLGDRELAETVADRLLQEPVFMNHSLDVNVHGEREVFHDAGSGSYVVCVSAGDDVVSLTGTVGSLTHMRLAEVIAWWTGACALIVNELEVEPPEEDNDNELTDAIRMVLEKDPLVDAGQVRVDTARGVVHVGGLTLSQEQRHAVLEDVWLVPGVVDVVDRIETHTADGISPSVA